MKALTAKQAAIYAYLRAFWKEEDRLPSSREIQARFGFASQNSGISYQRALCKKGYIEQRGRHYRFVRS